MTYTTFPQLTARYGLAMLVSLTDRAEIATEVVDLAVIERALTDTDATIDGYLAGRYVLPVSDVPPLLADLAQVVAIWKLHTHEPDPKIKLDYENALRTLREIAWGAVRLSVAGVEPEATGNSGARLTDRDRPLNAADMKGFI